MSDKENASATWLNLNEILDEPQDGEGRRLSSISKAALAGNDPAIQRSNLIDTDDDLHARFANFAVLEPSLRPTLLVRWYQLSSILQQLVACMVGNVVGAGYRLEKTIDLESDEGWETVKTAMMLRELDAAIMPTAGDDIDEVDLLDQIQEPENADVDAEVARLRKKQWHQKAIARRFLRNVNAKEDIISLLKRMDTDREPVGWGVLELRRDGRGLPSRLDHGRSWTFRAKTLDDPVETDVIVQTNDIDWDVEKDAIQFRRFIQVSPSTGDHRYFKEYGDPRTISSRSGDIYEDEEALKLKEPTAAPATELLWFPLTNPESSVYGLPRYSGNINSVVGSYHMETVNILFFRDKAIPPLVIMVSGGTLGAKLKEELKVALRDHLKGTENFHGVLIIEATPARGSGLVGTAGQNQVKVEFKPLTEAFFKDQLFGQYDQANRDKVRQSFRIPKLLIGDTDNINRATAETVVELAEAQIFKDDRHEIEAPINRVLRELGVTLWRFELQRPTMASSIDLIEQIVKATESDLVPEEGRAIIGKTLGIELDKLEGDWLHIPVRHYLAGVRPPTDSGRVDEDTADTLNEMTDQPPAKQQKIR